MKVIKRLTAYLVSILMILSCFSAFAVFAVTAESITYNVYNGEELIYSDDFRLNGAGEYDIFVSENATKITLFATTNENELPVYTEGGNEFSFEGDTASVAFTVSDEAYSLLFIKENEANTLISSISVNSFDSEGASDSLLFDYKPFLFDYSLSLPDNAVSISFDISAKEGAEVKINGKDVKESYPLSPYGTDFEITVTLGKLSYTYLFDFGGKSISSFTLTGDEGKTNFEKSFTVYGGSDVYTVLLPNEGASYRFDLVDDCIFYDADSGAEITDSFTFADGMRLVARDIKGNRLFDLVLKEAEDTRPVLLGVELLVYNGDYFHIYNMNKSENGFTANYFSNGDHLLVAPVFEKDYGYGYKLTLSGTEYSKNDGMPLFTGDAVLTVFYGEESFDYTVTLTAETEPPFISEMGFDFFDAAGNKIGRDALSVKSGEENKTICTVSADVTSVKLSKLLGRFFESFTVNGEATDTVPIGEDAVITVTNGEGSVSYYLRFEAGAEDFSLFEGFVIMPIDTDKNYFDAIIYQEGVTSYKLNYYTDGAFLVVTPKAFNGDIFVNGTEEIVLKESSFIFYLTREELGSELKIEFKVGGETVETVTFTVDYGTLEEPSLNRLDVCCYGKDGTLLGVVSSEEGKNYIDLLPDTFRYGLVPVSYNGYLDLFGNGSLLPLLALPEYGGNDVISVIGVKGPFAPEVFDFTLFKENYLSGITVNGTAIPDFSPDKFDYTVTVDGDTASVLPCCDFEGAELSYQGEVTLLNGEAVTEITVTNNGVSTVYTLTLKKAPSEPEKLLSESLILNRETGFISNFTPLADVSELIASFENAPERIKIFKGEAEVTSGAAATGMQVVLYDESGAETDRLTLVIYGEINGDGRVNTSDILQIVLHNNNSHLTGAKKAAADINGDGRINSSDILRIILFNNGTAIKQDR